MSERVSMLIRSSARAELAEALSSLAAQTYRNLDVVIVNVTGQPHPPLPPQAAALAVRLVEPGVQLPRPQAANAALDAATGDHVMFLDDDDLLEPDHIAACVAVAKANPQQLPFTGAQICGAQGELQAVWPALPFGALEIVERIRLQPSAALIPRAVIDEGFRFDPELPIFEDWDFWIRLSRRIPFRPVPANTAVCRLGLGTSGTGVGPNFDLERTARESRPFHAKWEGELAALSDEFAQLATDSEAAMAAGDLDRAEALCMQAQVLRIWDFATLARLARIAAARNDAERVRRFTIASQRARLLVRPTLTHTALTDLHDLLQRGNALALAGNYDAAEADFAAALALQDGDQTACNGLANIRIGQQRLSEAEDLLRQGMAWGDRAYPSLILKRGSLLEALGRREEARALYRNLAGLVPRFKAARDRLLALDAIEAAA